MIYAFDIIHPAHVHFFSNAIKKLLNRGDNVKVFSRKKELVCELLDEYGIKHDVLSRVMTGVTGLLYEMVIHQGRLLKRLIKEKPDVIVALGGPLCTHVARLRQCPVAIFTDTHIAFMQNLITLPFATRIFIPDCYPGPFYGFRRKFIKYAGYHELAYLHPKYFKPDPRIRDRLKLKQNERYSIVRFTAWKSSHDLTTSGLNKTQKRLLIQELLKFGRVFISSEDELSDDLQKYKFPLPGSSMHNALAYASLVVGESATMVSEAVVLGTGGIYISPVHRCYTDDQETNYKLARTINPNKFDEILIAINDSYKGKAFQNITDNHHKLIESKIDVTEFIISSITAMAIGHDIKIDS